MRDEGDDAKSGLRRSIPSPMCEKRISGSNDENVREKTRLTVSHARLFRSG